jgi:uncharacterized membrane protein
MLWQIRSNQLPAEQDGAKKAQLQLNQPPRPTNIVRISENVGERLSSYFAPHLVARTIVVFQNIESEVT